jgi:hypothetical protein
MYWLLLLLFILTINITAAIPNDELNALLDLYHSTSGITWRRKKWPQILTSFKTADSRIESKLKELKPCEWTGVTCKNNHVVSLKLEHSLDGGTLPSSLAVLNELETLDFGTNGLTGTLPSEWGYGLKSIQQIELDGNHFHGTIPESWLSFFEKDELLPQPGASQGGARVFIGFNIRLKNDIKRELTRDGEDNGPEPNEIEGYGFDCPYPSYLSKVKNDVKRNGKLVKSGENNVATSWGLTKECGLAKTDSTPDEEEPSDWKEEEEEEEDDLEQGEEEEEEDDEEDGEEDDEEDDDEDDEDRKSNGEEENELHTEL